MVYGKWEMGNGKNNDKSYRGLPYTKSRIVVDELDRLKGKLIFLLKISSIFII